MRIAYFSLADLSDNPYPEVALPALARIGAELQICAPNASRSILNFHLPFPSVRIDLPPRSSRGRSEFVLLMKMIAARFSKHDIIYVNSQALSSRAALAYLGPLLSKRVVYHNPDYYDPALYPFRCSLEGRVVRKSSIYINNEFHRGMITASNYGYAGITLTAPPNLPLRWPIPGHDMEKRKQLTAGQTDAFVLMLHGGYSHLRMVPQLLAALAQMPNRVRIALTGGERTRNQVEACEFGRAVKDRVTFLPRLPFQEMLSYSVNADAGVLLYQNNDIGNFFTAPGRITEYLACGLPVLGTNHTGLENLILKFDIGKAVDSTRPAAIAAGVEGLMRKYEGVACRDRMRQTFVSHFAFDHWEDEIVTTFQSLPDAKAQPRPAFPWQGTC